jgi:hypothetical protein
MDIDSYLRISNINHKEYKIIRYKEYKKKYGDDLKEFQFINMLKYVPENSLDDQYYFKYIKAQSELKHS